MAKIKDKKVELREIVYSQDDEKSFGDIFVYEPENIDEHNLGNLFIIGELKDLPRNCSYIINLLASKIKKEFYSNTKRSAEDSLEAGLSIANQTLSDLANQGNGEYVGKLSMACGTYKGDKFYLSQVGKIKSLLIRSERILEIMKEEDSKPASSSRAFNNIASGELEDGDMVIFATPGLFNIFSLEELRRMGSSMQLDDFSAKLQEEIEEEDDQIVSALVMDIGEKKRKEGIGRTGIDMEEKYKRPETLQEILGSEKEEEKLPEENLAPEDAGDVKEDGRILSQDEDKERKAEKSGVEVPIDISAQKNSRPSAEETENDARKSVGNEAANDTPLPEKETEKISLSDIIKEYERRESKPAEYEPAKDKSIEQIALKKESSSFDDLDKTEDSFPKRFSSKAKDYLNAQNVKNAKNSIVNRIKKAGKTEKEYRIDNRNKKFSLISGRKLVVVMLAVLIIIAGGSYFYGHVKNNNDQQSKLASYRIMLADSTSKMNQAKTELSSGTPQNAASLFAQARDMAARVKSEYGGNLNPEADTIITQAQAQLDILDKITRIENPDIVASFDNANMTGIVTISGTNYVIDGQENSVYKIDAKNGKLVLITKAGNDKLETIKSSHDFQGQEILLLDGAAFSSFSARNNAIRKLNATIDSPVADFATYNKYIYLLSPSANQIYKYQESSQSLTGKTEWLKGGDIKDAVSIAVDQYIYILTGDGQVKKYFTGSEYADADGKKFALQQPSDKISAPEKIYTLSDQKFLYVTESSKNRILVFDKESGILMEQYVSLAFADLKGISVDSKETALLALVKDKVIKIDLTEN